MDKAMGYYPENEDINPYSNDSYKEESKASDSEERNIVPDEFQSVIDYYTTLNNRGLTIEELLVELPHYSHNVYELPTDLNYMMTFEFQFLESNVFANDKGFLNILSVMLSNHQLHNNPPSHELQRDTIDVIIEHYTNLIQANLEIDVPQNFRTESEIRNSLKVPTEITLVQANPTLESNANNSDVSSPTNSRSGSPLLDLEDDNEVLTEYYGFSVDNPDRTLQDVSEIFPNVFENPDAYLLPEGVKYTDLSLYPKLYQLSKTSLTLRHILVIQMTNHELVANYDLEDIGPEIIQIRKELIIKNYQFLNNKDNEIN
jgi:hypothetical protein